MSRYTRREFLKTGLAAGTLATAGSLPLFATRETATDWVTLGKSGVNATRLRHSQLQRPGAARPGTGRVYEAGALRLRQRHSLLRDCRILRRHAQYARSRPKRS